MSRLTLLVLLGLVPRVALGQIDTSGARTGVLPVFLNGAPFLEARSIGATSDLHVDATALIASIDGAAPTNAPRASVRGTTLVAHHTGACAACTIRVVRAVLISSRIRHAGGQTLLPLADVVTALEGRLDRSLSPPRLLIHVGRCTWCILEPVNRSPQP